MPDFEPVKKKTTRRKQTLAQSLFPCKTDSAGEVVRKIVFLAAIAVLIAATAIIVYFYFIRSDNINKEMDEVKNMRAKATAALFPFPCI